jgi:uncharacterized membrane protein
MLGSGALHLVAPKPYERIVPRSLGDARRVVVVSGVVELACGTLLLSRRTSRLGGWLTAALLVAVFPANVQMVLDAGTEHQAIPSVPAGRFRAMALARLPLQIPSSPEPSASPALRRAASHRDRGRPEAGLVCQPSARMTMRSSSFSSPGTW